MLLRRVEDVGHPGALQVVQVTHRLPVTDDDARADLNRVRFNYVDSNKIKMNRILIDLEPIGSSLRVN